MTTTHPSADLLFKWIRTDNDGYLFVTQLDARDCGPDDGRTGMAIVDGFRYVDHETFGVEVHMAWEYSDRAEARYVPADVKKAVRKFIGREYTKALAWAKENGGPNVQTRRLAKAYRLSIV